MRRNLTRKTAGGIRPELWVIAGAIALWAIVAAPGWSAPPVEPEVLAEVEQNFRVLPLEDGWLLEPLDGELELPVIQVKPGSFAIDGQRVSEDELRARLGDLAEAVVELSHAAEDQDEPAMAAVARAEERRLRAEKRRLEAEERRIEVEERVAERRERHQLHRDRSDSQVVVGSDLTIEEDDVYRDVVVFGGRLTVAGQVIGDAVAIGGSATVSGEITGDLAVVGGSIVLEDGARIMGDVVSVGGSIDQAEDIDVAGQIIEVPFAPRLNFGNFGNWGNWGNWGDWGGRDWDVSRDARRWGQHARWFGFFEAGWELLGVLFCALLACLVYLIARNPVERVARKVSDEPWKSGLVGLLVQILCLPILVLVCLVLLISIIGIPLLLLVPFAILGFILVAFLGYTAVAFRLGGWSEQRFGWDFGNPYFSLLLGVGVIEIWALVGEILSFGPGPIRFFAAMFALFGCLVIYVAWTVGLGGAVLTRFGTWGDLMGPPPPPSAPTAPGYDGTSHGSYAVADDLVDVSEPSAHEPSGWEDAAEPLADLPTEPDTDPNEQDERL